MAEQLDFSLPQRKAASPGPSKVLVVLLVLILAAVAVDLFLSARGTPSTVTSDIPGLSPEAQKDLALRLEKQGLTGQAATAWREYLEMAGPDADEMAKIYYRMGKLYQEHDAYAEALDCFYRSESAAPLDDLAPEIARRTAECLEALGKFAALRYELAERVSVDPDSARAGSDVVAEIGPQKITKADLDEAIERQIDVQMSRFAAYLPESQKNQYKEKLLKQSSSQEERMRFLNQMVAQEILVRKAREEKLVEDAETRALIRDAERAILTQRVIEKEMADQIKITPSDVETYYQAHREAYTSPERAHIAQILVADAQQAGKLLDRLKDGADFAKLAAEASLDDATKSQGGAVKDWIHRGEPAEALGYAEDADVLIFNTEAGKVCDGTIQSDRGFHIIQVLERQAPRQRSFDEVQDDVLRELRSRKERDVQQRLLDQLKDTYDVVIHRDALAGAAPVEPETPDPNPTL